MATETTPRYTTEPGRHIYRDGQPFVFIGRCTPTPNHPDLYISPSEADATTRHITELLNAEAKIREALEAIHDEAEHILRTEADEPYEVAVLNAEVIQALARDALAVLGK